jgi:uncharacterized membrane protein YbhN (UPF0104 family)
LTRILKHKLFTIGIKIAFAGFAFWFLSKKLDYSKLPELFYTMNYSLLVLALLLQSLSIIIAAYRWKRVMQPLGFNENSLFYQKLYFTGFFFSQSLPGSIGGDAVRLLALTNKGYHISDSLYGIFIDRVVGLVGLLLINLFALLFAPNFLTSSIVNTALLISLGGLFGFFLLAVLHKIINFDAMPKLHFLGELSKRLLKVHSNNRKALFQIFLSIIIHLLSILSIYSISVAANLGVEFGAFLCLMPLVILLTILPISFAGWGVREGAMVALFAMSGANKEAIMAVSIAYGVILIVSSLPGFATWLNSKNIA